MAQEDVDDDNDDGIQILSAESTLADVERRLSVQESQLLANESGIEDSRSRTLRGRTITPKSNSSPPEQPEVPSLAPPQKTILDTVDQSMFRPRQASAPASARLSSASEAVAAAAPNLENSSANVTTGLVGAMIEDFYQGSAAEADIESQDYQARWIPQYDYSDTEEDISMSGFGVESKKAARDIPADLMSSDDEGSDDAPMPSSMWASWGGSKIVQIHHEDQEMTEMTDGGKSSPSTIGEDLDAEIEDNLPPASVPVSTTTTAPITSFPFLDPDAQRAWRTGDVDWHDLEEKAGWFNDLGVTSPKVLYKLYAHIIVLGFAILCDGGDAC